MSHGPSNKAAVVAVRHLQRALASQMRREAFQQLPLNQNPPGSWVPCKLFIYPWICTTVCIRRGFSVRQHMALKDISTVSY